MSLRKIQFLVWFVILQGSAFSQDNLYTSYTTPEERSKLQKRLVQNTINKNLKKALNDSTEENWQDAFSSLELMTYHTPWVDKRISLAVDSILSRTRLFKRALLELIYANYPGQFSSKVKELTNQNEDTKLFAMAAEYLMRYAMDSSLIPHLKRKLNEFPEDDSADVYLEILRLRINEVVDSNNTLIKHKAFADILGKNFLPGETVMYSFQRRDRSYPGLLVIRLKDGTFLRDSSGMIFNVPQLARSVTDLPFYFTNGNTPQGVFNMHGFDVSKSSFIGPTPNIQLAMPVEIGKRKFFRDSVLVDTGWTFSDYAQVLPLKLRSYLPLYGSYYAGLAGRTEIISHGTTVDPEYYKGQSYYPQTPTLGCLCTKEIWNGKRVESDQLKLVNALLRAGGAHGYAVVLELDNKRAAVQLEELLPYIGSR